MNRSITFGQLGGLYVYQDTLDFLQKACSESLQYISNGLGNKYILTGVQVVGGQVSNGAVVIGNEVLFFLGGPELAYVKVEAIITQELFDDATLKDTYTTRRLKMVAIADVDTFPFSDLKRLPLDNSSVYDSLDKYHQILKSLINFEPEVILSGLLVTNVTAGPDECDISAGLVMFNGQVISVPAFSGAYPQYLTEAGAWQAGVPGAGLYITFDPHTSQRYVDVLNRAMVKAGKIEMYETLTDRFVGGVGRWEMKGFSLAANMQNRVPVGLWFDGVAVANVSHASHIVAGNDGGENKHQLTQAELPDYNLDGPLTANTDSGVGGYADGTPINEIPLAIPSGGSDTPHNNMQPFRVIVYVKRT